MNIKMKTTLIILFTFIIGMVTGILVTRAFIEYRMKKILSMRAPWGFAEHFERIIEPTEKQREQVRKILFKYGEKLFAIGEKIRQEALPIQEAMREELDAILTPEQKERLEKRFLGHGPGPGFGPGRGPRPGGFFGDKPPLGMEKPPFPMDKPPGPPPWLKDPKRQEEQPKKNETKDQ